MLFTTLNTPEWKQDQQSDNQHVEKIILKQGRNKTLHWPQPLHHGQQGNLINVLRPPLAWQGCVPAPGPARPAAKRRRREAAMRGASPRAALKNDEGNAYFHYSYEDTTLLLLTRRGRPLQTQNAVHHGGTAAIPSKPFTGIFITKTHECRRRRRAPQRPLTPGRNYPGYSGVTFPRARRHC